MSARRRLTLQCNRSGERLDRFIVDAVPWLGRRSASKLCAEKQVTVNDRPEQAGFLLRVGDRVEFELDQSEPIRARAELVSDLNPSPAWSEIVFENQQIIVLNKRRAVHCVTQSWEDSLTVADCLAAYSRSFLHVSADPREAGLLQRLDYYTSGLLVAAKSTEVWNKLHLLMVTQGITKEYLALVQGELKEEQTIDYPLSPVLGGKKVAVLTEQEQEPKGALGELPRSSAKAKRLMAKLVRARSVVRPAGRHPLGSLVTISGESFRRHQIRAHLAAIGLPLVGDELYGATTKLFNLSGEPIEGFFLQAVRLSFPASIIEGPIEFRILPDSAFTPRVSVLS